MEQLELLRLVATTLDGLGIRYAVVGSFASGAWGEPRMTQDIDILIEVDVFDVELLCAAFADEAYYVSKSAAQEAVSLSTQFILLHPASGNKIDFMIAGDGGWARGQLDRAIAAPLLPDQQVQVSMPEDVILGKLIYYRDGGSEKHLRDITGILTAGAVEVDREYVGRHAAELGVHLEWKSILDKLEAM